MDDNDLLDRFYTPWQRHQVIFALAEKRHNGDIYAAAEEFKTMEALTPDDLKVLIERIEPNEQAPGWKPE